jgi:hypothetical protein
MIYENKRLRYKAFRKLNNIKISLKISPPLSEAGVK